MSTRGDIAVPANRRPRRVGVVGVDVDLERGLRRRPRAPSRRAPRARRRSPLVELRAGDDEVGAVAVAGLVMDGGVRVRRGVMRNLGEAARIAPASPATSPRMITTSPSAPASTTPASASGLELLGRVAQRLLAGEQRRRPASRRASRSARLGGRPGSSARAAQLVDVRSATASAIARITVSIVPSAGLAHRRRRRAPGRWRAPPRSAPGRSAAPPGRQNLGGAADDLAQDHARVAAGAHQRRAGHLVDDVRCGRRRPGNSSAGRRARRARGASSAPCCRRCRRRRPGRR